MSRTDADSPQEDSPIFTCEMRIHWPVESLLNRILNRERWDSGGAEWYPTVNTEPFVTGFWRLRLPPGCRGDAGVARPRQRGAMRFLPTVPIPSPFRAIPFV